MLQIYQTKRKRYHIKVEFGFFQSLMILMFLKLILSIPTDYVERLQYINAFSNDISRNNETNERCKYIDGGDDVD